MFLKKTIIILILGLVFSASQIFVSAETEDERRRAELETELEELEREIARAKRDLTMTEAEKQSLQHQINRLQNEINYLTAQINRNRVLIENLGLEIADTEESIRKTTAKIESSREELSEILRTLYMDGRISTLETLLIEDSLSSFFNNLNSLERLSTETKNILDDVTALRAQLRDEKAVLERDKAETERVARMHEAQKAQEEAARREQEQLLEMTEEEYQRQLAEKEDLERQAEEIRQRIFELVGLPPEVDVPSFEEAYEIAKWVSNATGVRPAFLLSIIQQESALGRNVGQCYLVDTTSGRTRNINTGRIYNNGIAAPANHPSRNDLSVFIDVTKELGRDPMQTRVSCTMIQGGAEVGYGGAMGPAQFIPTTWQMVRSEVTGILGYEPDPWSIRDSFMASGVLLKNNGASPQTRQAEWNAAMRYFTGGTTNSRFFWYADQVINRADQFERDIEIMLQN